MDQKVFKKTLAAFLAALFLLPVFVTAASALTLSDGFYYDDGIYYDEDEDYDTWLKRQEAIERARKTASFIIGGVILPVFGIAFFAVMWIKKKIPSSRCAVVLVSLAIYVGVRTAYFIITL
ncbi:MAG: hypothetical protein IJV00_08320 [Clostridia bacterium]|nr:hypothetical protein [Clostridia bacterium]